MAANYRALETAWHERLRSAAADWERAARHYKQLLGNHRGEPHSDRSLLLTQALHVETLALERYRLTLEVFTDLILRRKLPPEE